MDTGKLACDMMMVAEPSYSLELMEGGWLHAYKSPEAANLAFEYDPDGYWYPVRVCNMVLGYNPELKSKDEIPNSFYDLHGQSFDLRHHHGRRSRPEGQIRLRIL